MYSQQIIKLKFTSNDRFFELLSVLCPDIDLKVMKNPKYNKETEIFREQILKDIDKSPVLSKLVNSSMLDLPNTVFINKISTTYRKIITLNGYPFDVVKSGMQKYARRGYPEKCIYTMVEMYFFKFMSDKSPFTNFINRIKVIFLEDIGVASPHAIVLASTLIDNLKKNNSEYPVEIPMLAYLMSNSLKYRLFSYIRADYVHKTVKPHVSKHLMYEGISDKDREVLGEIVDSLVYSMEKKDPSCYVWIEKLYNSKHKLTHKKYKSTKPAFLVFDILAWFLQLEQTQKLKTISSYMYKLILDNLSICLEWYKSMTNQESIICLFHPVYLYVYSSKFEPQQINDILNFLPDKKVENYWIENLSNNNHEFMNAVYDTHTKIGKARGKTSIDFAVEGSMVVYEDSYLHKSALKQNYVNCKLIQENMKIPSERSVFEFKVRTQLTCSNARQDVYFARENGRNVVVKGPFLSYEEVNMSVQVSKIFSLFRGVNVMDKNIKLLIPDMYKKVGVGIRNKIADLSKPYYFLIMEDLFNQDTYPTHKRTTNSWENEPVVNFDKFFSENPQFGTADPKYASENAKISIIIQTVIRYVFKVGDFAARNFIRVGDQVWNIDLEKVMVNNVIRWKNSDKMQLYETYKSNKKYIDEIIQSWLENFDPDKPTLYSRWYMVKRVLSLTDEQILEIKQNISNVLDDFSIMFWKS
jgi:hypothetical protein